MKPSQLENLIKKQGLVNVRAPLDTAYEQLIPETIQEAHKIQSERVTDESLRREWFITGDGAVYTLEKEKTFLYFTNTKLNPVLKKDNINDAVTQIRKTKNYHVKGNDLDVIKRAAKREDGSAVKIDLSKLDLQRYDSEWSYFTVNTKKYDSLNDEQRKMAESIHGKGQVFMDVMREMKKAGISEIRIYVLNPEYVKKNAKDGAVARVGWLSDFDGDANFDAGYRLIDDDGDRVRGVRKVAEGDGSRRVRGVRKVAEGDRVEKETPFDYGMALDGILDEPEQTLEHLDKKKAAGLLDIVNKFYQEQ